MSYCTIFHLASQISSCPLFPPSSHSRQLREFLNSNKFNEPFKVQSLLILAASPLFLSCFTVQVLEILQVFLFLEHAVFSFHLRVLAYALSSFSSLCFMRPWLGLNCRPLVGSKGPERLLWPVTFEWLLLPCTPTKPCAVLNCLNLPVKAGIYLCWSQIGWNLKTVH